MTMRIAALNDHRSVRTLADAINASGQVTGYYEASTGYTY